MAPSAAAASPSFGALLKRYRRAAGLTQEQLAEHAGYSVGHISKLESSVRHPVPATVELLAEALELEPVERGVLERASRPAAPARQPHPPPMRPLPQLVDRRREVACIERHCAEAGPPLLLLAGEPGIGKSRLLQEAAARGTRAGWFVAVGTCRRTGGGPYEPLLQALADAAHRLNPEELRTALLECRWLVRLLPELAETGATLLPAWTLPADQERRLMFGAVERFLRNIAGPAGTLLVLDNLQWAGPDALDLLRALIDAAPQCMVRIIGAFRSTEVRPESPLGSVIADLAIDRLITLETVGPLAPDAAVELLSVRITGAGPVDERLRLAVLQKSGGVPFALVSYAQWLRDAAPSEQEGLTEPALPWSLAQMVRQRIAALPRAAQVIVRIAAVAEGDDPRELLSAVAQRLGYDELTAARALDAACEAGLLVERDHDTYGFVHDITQEVVLQSLGTAQRAHLHHEIAEALASKHERPREAEALAAHYVEAGEPNEAAVYFQQAGTWASALHAHAAAEQAYRSLAEHLDRHGRAEEAARAHEHLGTALAHLGRHDEALEELERAVAAYRAAGDADGRGRVAAQMGWVYDVRGEPQRGIARLEREVANAADLPDRSLALLLVSLARLYSLSQLYVRALECAEQAVALSRTVQDADVQALAEMERATALGMMDRLAESLRILEHVAIPLSGAAGELWTQTLALDRATTDHIRRGEFDTALADLKQGLALAHQLDDRYLAAVMIQNRGVLRYFTGSWQRARAHLVRANVMLQTDRTLARAAQAAVWLGRLELVTGRWRLAQQDLVRGADLAERSGDAASLVTAQCTLAELALASGNAEEARLRLEPLLSGTTSRESDLTEALALLGSAHLALGDVQQAEALVAASAMRAAATGLRCALADALRLQALVAARAGRWEEARGCSVEAVTLARELAYVYAEAKARCVHGQLLLRQGEAVLASEQFAAARALLARLGERLYADQLERVSAGQSAALF
jgi:predicted ATPase